MKNSKTIINIIIGLLVLVAIGAGYFYFFGTSQESAVGISGSALSAGAPTTLVAEGTSEFLILLDSIQTVDLGGKIFSNTIFASQLQDFATLVPARAQGRSNPFAPLGTANVSQSVAPAEPAGGSVNFFESNN